MEANWSQNRGLINNNVSGFTDPSNFFYRAIENAEGVPFQLIFGQHIGEGHYLTIGSGINQLLNIAPADFTEKRYHEMIKEIIPLTPDIPGNAAETRRKFINGEINSYRAELLVQLPSGEKKWIRDASLPIKDEETGKVIGAFGILLEITGRNKSLRSSDKVEEREEDYNDLKVAFLRNISHEIRTPLNAIVGFSTLLGEPGNSYEDQRNFMEIITSSTDHLLGLISNIVEMSEIEAGSVRTRMESESPRKILTDIYNRFRNEADAKGIYLSYVAPAGINGLMIHTDWSKVRQSLENLVNNAIKFTPKGNVQFGFEMKEGKVEFYVTDTGIGIAEEKQQKIFNRFYQGDAGSTRNFEGIGLGLTITKAYIEMLGGKIWLNAKPGAGSEFRFDIPVEIGNL